MGIFIQHNGQQTGPFSHMAPFVKGRAEFDPMPFDNNAVILWSDNSVRPLPIDRITREVILDGQNLLDPTHPIWGGVPPSLLLPE